MRHFDLAALPVGERKAALRNLVLAWRPFAEPDHAVIWSAEGALAIAWDAAAARAALDTAELDAKDVRLVPEVLLREPIDDGVRLIDGIDGVEAQRWQQRVLVASRWWPEAPSASEWRNFLHAAKATPEVAADAVPAVQRPMWRGTAWARPRGLDTLGGAFARWESLAAMSVAACLVAATAALAHRWFLVERNFDQLQLEKRALDAALGPTLAARDRALQQLVQVQALSTKLVALQPLEVMQHLADVLPKKGVLLKELELNGSKLRLGLGVDDTVARSALIRDLQSGGWFKDVAEPKDASFKGGLSMEMNIDGPQPVAVRAATAAPPGLPALPATTPPLPAGTAANAKLPGGG